MDVVYWTADADVWCTRCVEDGALDACPVYEEQALADAPQHCAQCKRLLDARLTEGGVEYVAGALDAWPAQGRLEILEEWAERYRDDLVASPRIDLFVDEHTDVWEIDLDRHHDLEQDLLDCARPDEAQDAGGTDPVDFVLERYRVVASPAIDEAALREEIRRIGSSLAEGS